jgi:hypothetical protein
VPRKWAFSEPVTVFSIDVITNHPLPLVLVHYPGVRPAASRQDLLFRSGI